ncbi:rolling circle replication-associated protein [Runella slithyformis]|nr:hypothetical protein [Runella slithyformis]
MKTSNKRDKSLDKIVGKVLKWDFSRIAKFKPHSVVTTQRYMKTGDFTGSYEVSATSKANLLQNKDDATGYNGYMSEATRRHVKGILENWLTSIELNALLSYPVAVNAQGVYPTFVTLTLPCKQMHDDRDLKENCFHPFMNEMIRKYGVKNFLWVSETQKNGNIHFHAIFDRKVDAYVLRHCWNRHIDKFPYCYVQDYASTQRFIYRKGFFVRKDMYEMGVAAALKRAKAEGRKMTKAEAGRNEEKRQRNAYELGEASKWKNPNSTDIHALKSIKKLTAYVSKYFTKKPEIKAPVLAENQRLVENNGKYFIETTPGPDDEQMWGDSNLKAYTPTFTVRRMRGRIWGSSAALKAPETKPVPFSCVLDRKVCEMVTYEAQFTRKIKTSVPWTDITGQTRYKVVKHEVTETTTYEAPEYPENTQHRAALRYLINLKETVVSQDEIKKATERAGPLFLEMKGEVIPLRDTQRELMQEYAPDLYQEYNTHYKNVFARLYSGQHTSETENAQFAYAA